MSSYRTSVVMLSSTKKEENVTGEAVRAGGFYGLTHGNHTVQVTVNNFTGGFGVQGTLSLDPKEEDWFWVKLTPTQDLNTELFQKYPKDPHNPTGSNSINTNHVGDTITESFLLKGNFTFLRAVVTRDYIEPKVTQEADGTWEYGQVDRVLLCF